MTGALAASSLTVDASVVVALLIDDGPAGQWAVAQCRGHRLIAPSLLHYEVADVLRRQVRAGLIGADRAHAAHRGAVDLQVQLWPYRAVAERVWALRDTLTSYDASYCAVAELAQAPLVTLDGKLALAVGPTCEIRVFGGEE
jgi:predicted nucleic acid-binding protein